MQKDMKTALLFVTHKMSEGIKMEIDKLHAQACDRATLYVIYQADMLAGVSPEGILSHPFALDGLNALGYPAWGSTLMDGNFHFVVLDFYRHHPGYDYYWLVEYDVRFNGNWRTFFSFFENRDEDFVTAHVERVEDNPHWPRWGEIELTNIDLEEKDMLRSFNPICRFSNRALSLLDERCSYGDRGHNEVLMPTLFRHYQLKIVDFGGMGPYILQGRPYLFYKEYVGMDGLRTCTHRFRPTYQAKDINVPNMIYHPVK